MDASIVVPTYNEAENIPLLIRGIEASLNSSDISYEILIVDDDSVDGTYEAVLECSHAGAVRFISRAGKPRGLSLSVLEGFLQAKGKVCVVMDADLSHPTERLPEMIRPILSDCVDICIGSRFVNGGKIEGWPWYRKVISKGAAILSYGLCMMSDPTSGFMAINRQLLDSCQLDPKSWKIVLEVVTKCPHARRRDVPIIFKDRVLGESKLSFKEQWCYVSHLCYLYFYKYETIRSFSKFMIVGLVGLFVDMFIFFMMVKFFSFDLRVSTAGAFLVASGHNYFFNKIWTFDNVRPFSIREYLLFTLVCIFGLCIRFGFMHGSLLYFSFISLNLALFLNFVGICLATVSNYVGSRWVLFSRDYSV